MTFQSYTICAIVLACAILQVCHTYEHNQLGVESSFASIPPSTKLTESARTSFLPPPLHYLDPKAKRKITVITKNGKRYRFFTTVSALSALIPLEPAAAYPAPATPAPAAQTSTLPSIPANFELSTPTPSITSLAATTKPTETKFVLLYRPIASQPQFQAFPVSTSNTALAQYIPPYLFSATTQRPTLQAIHNILPPEITTALPPSQPLLPDPAPKASASQEMEYLDTPLTSAEVKELALETLKHPNKVWKYLKYKFQTRRTTKTTTQKPVDNAVAHGYAVLAKPKSSTPATLWKKMTSMYDKASMRDIALSGDPLYSYGTKSLADQNDSSEDFMT